jgi:hypothetical protein
VHRRAIVFLLFISALVLAGCTTPPKAERAVAEDAVNAARAAGAEQYAPGEFALAIRALEAAAAQMDAHRYREAKALYEQVPSLSDKTARAAGRGKATQRAGVEQQLTGAERRWQALEGRLKAATVTLKPDRRQAATSARRIMIETLQLVRSLASDDPEVARDRLTVVTAMLDQWEAELKAPRASAKKP